MKTKLLSLVAFCAITFASAQTTLISEAFNDITTLTTWTQTNQSLPVGTSGWFQGNTTVFDSQAGAPTAYIGANFNNTTGANTISNWLITPQLLVQNGDILKFWTRTSTSAAFADRLEVRSSQGSTFTAPSGPTGIGSFSTLHLTLNPDLVAGQSNGYPFAWTEYTITVAGVSSTPVPVNFAFRYFVTNGGPAGDNSNFIGIDTFSVTRPALAVSDASKSKNAVYPNPATDVLNVDSASKISSVQIFDMSGKKVAAELVGNKVDVKNLAKGSYVIKIQDQDGTSTQKFIKK